MSLASQAWFRCDRKIPYPHAGIAESAAKRATKRAGHLIVAYECPECGSFHIGRADKSQLLARGLNCNPAETIKRVISSEPIDRNAASVMRSGEHYQHKAEYNGEHSHTPIPTCNTRERGLALLGKRFGRLTVIGQKAGTQQMVFVVRCACGAYETRRAKAIENPKNGFDACEDCRHVMYLKRNAIWKSTGMEIPYEELV